MADGGHEVARIGSVEIDCRPRLAAAEQADQTVEPQPGLLLLGAVAADAPLDEHRADPGFEEIKGVIGREPRRRDRAEQHHRPQARGQTALDGTTTPAR